MVDFKECKNHPGYSVTADGRVWSHPTGRHNGMYLKHMLDKGYCRVRLNKGNRCRVSVHRLVAEAFIPNPDNLPEVHHKDHNKQNNCVSNLMWMTKSDNHKEKHKHHRQPFWQWRKDLQEVTA